MKKRLKILLIGVMLCGLFAACNSSENEDVDYAYVDIVYDNMDIWEDYEGNSPWGVNFLTYRSTGETGVSFTYIVGRMAVVRNYYFQDGTILLDKDGTYIKGGLQYDNYEEWNSGGTDEQKYEQLKSIYDGHLEMMNE